MKTTMETPETLAQALETSFADLCTTLDLLSEHERELPGVDGGWPAKVQLAHVAFWDDFQTSRMEAALGGKSTGGFPRPDHDNEERAGRDAARPWAEVLAAAQQARARMAEFARGVDPAVLVQDFPEGERRFSIARQLRHMVAHTYEHERPIRRFCGSMQRWTRAALRAFLVDQHARLIQGATVLSEADLMQTPVCGYWTTRDVLAHVMSWNEHADRLIGGWPEPEPAAVAKWPLDVPMDTLNDRLTAARAAWTIDEIYRELERLHSRMLRAFDNAVDSKLRSEGQTWRGLQPLSLQFYEVAVHEQEHADQVLGLSNGATSG